MSCNVKPQPQRFVGSQCVKVFSSFVKYFTLVDSLPSWNMFNAKIGSWKDPCYPIVSSNHVEGRGTFIEACMDRLTCCTLHINIAFLLAVDIRGTGYVNSQYFYQCENMEWFVPRRSPWPISRGNVCLPLFARRHMGRRYKWRGCFCKQKKPLQRKVWWLLYGLLVL